MGSRAQQHAGAKDAISSLKRAEQFISELQEGAKIPVTPDDLKRGIEEFSATLKKNQDAANALVLAVLADEPCPVSLFRPWASYAQIRLWAMRDKKPLPTQKLNGKLCVKPTDFFRALREHGKGQN